MQRTVAAALVGAVALLSLAACGGDDDSAAATGAGKGAAESTPTNGDVAAEVKTFRFQPEPIEIDAGTTVTWTNRDNILHTVTSGAAGKSDGRFDEQLDGSGATGSVAFDDPGRYEYFCSRHAGMQGVVVVK
jgi:plastocyanin